jgi:signal transduction histidine kinase
MDSPEILSDRQDTDESLKAERQKTDDLLQGEGRIADEVVEERQDDTRRRLRDVREETDAQLEKQADVLPAVTEKLEHVADTLVEAAANLTGVAGTLKESLTFPPQERAVADDGGPRSAVDVVNNLVDVADELKATADQTPGIAEAPARLAGQLAAVAEGIAEVTDSLAAERRDGDVGLQRERELTDQILVQELKQAEDELATELHEERQVLASERHATDEDLAEERQHTDQAVEHVLQLLGEEIKAHAEARRHVSTRNEFLSIVSHDLRGPLMSISGSAAIIERAILPSDWQSVGQWVAHIRRSVDVMERLINDLLEFGSLEDGRLRVNAESRDIRDVIHRAIEAFQPVAAEKSLTLTAEAGPNPVMVKYDHHRLFQVLSNVIRNSIKFTPGGGSICIRVLRAGDECQVSISDTGIGIPEGELQSIFERFRQLDGTGTGLGLGLYISRWIIEAHGGRIWAESRVGSGATLFFTLPAD